MKEDTIDTHAIKRGYYVHLNLETLSDNSQMFEIEIEYNNHWITIPLVSFDSWHKIIKVLEKETLPLSTLSTRELLRLHRAT